MLEASGRAGGHVRTVHDPLADGLYADVGAEHFYYPGYTVYWRYLKEFGLHTIAYPRRDNMVRFFGGKLYTEKDLQATDDPRATGLQPERSRFPGERRGGICRCSTSSATSIESATRTTRSAPASTIWIRSSRRRFVKARRRFGGHDPIRRRLGLGAANDLERPSRNCAARRSQQEAVPLRAGISDDRRLRRPPGQAHPSGLSGPPIEHCHAGVTVTLPRIRTKRRRLRGRPPGQLHLAGGPAPNSRHAGWAEDKSIS